MELPLSKEEISNVLKEVFDMISIFDKHVESLGCAFFGEKVEYGIILMLYNGRPIFHETDMTLEDILYCCMTLHKIVILEKLGQ